MTWLCAGVAWLCAGMTGEETIDGRGLGWRRDGSGFLGREDFFWGGCHFLTLLDMEWRGVILFAVWCHVWLRGDMGCGKSGMGRSERGR